MSSITTIAGLGSLVWKCKLVNIFSDNAILVILHLLISTSRINRIVLYEYIKLLYIILLPAAWSLYRSAMSSSDWNGNS